MGACSIYLYGLTKEMWIGVFLVLTILVLIFRKEIRKWLKR